MLSITVSTAVNKPITKAKLINVQNFAIWVLKNWQTNIWQLTREIFNNKKKELLLLNVRKNLCIWITFAPFHDSIMSLSNCSYSSSRKEELKKKRLLISSHFFFFSKISLIAARNFYEKFSSIIITSFLSSSRRD